MDAWMDGHKQNFDLFPSGEKKMLQGEPPPHFPLPQKYQINGMTLPAHHISAKGTVKFGLYLNITAL